MKPSFNSSDGQKERSPSGAHGRSNDSQNEEIEEEQKSHNSINSSDVVNQKEINNYE